jgi:hypothetical protein
MSWYGKNESEPDTESIREAMRLAWKDHHHARDQTWKGVQIVAVLVAGMITVDIQFANVWATVLAGVPVIVAAIFGYLITVNHRKLERRKFIHIMNCEERLGLHKDDIIPYDPKDGSLDKKDPYIKNGAVSIPELYRPIEILNPIKQNTSLFIARIHWAMIAFSLIFIAFRWLIHLEYL